MSRCTHCNQKLKPEEIDYYGASCDACEHDYMAMIYGVSGWRHWILTLRYWWRRITA